MRRLLLLLTLTALPFVAQDPKPKTRSTGPVVGKPAPTFRVNDHTGKAVRVGDKSDAWTVLAFYPMAATPG